METIEIRYNKFLIYIIGIFTIASFYSIYATYYLSTQLKNDKNANTILALIIGQIIGIVLLARAIYKYARQILKNEPVLTLSKSGIELNPTIGKPALFLWQQVDNWTIEKDSDGHKHLLIIESANQKTSAHRTWLEKSPEEIEALLEQYKPKIGEV
jgi:hypothetical protein